MDIFFDVREDLQHARYELAGTDQLRTQSLPVKHKVRFHYHAFLLWLYSAVHQALEKQRFENEAEERLMNELAAAGNGEGYPWSRREEQKALALTKGWYAAGLLGFKCSLLTRVFFIGDPSLREDDRPMTQRSTRESLF